MGKQENYRNRPISQQSDPSAVEQADREVAYNSRDIWDTMSDLLPPAGAAIGAAVATKLTKKRARYLQSKVEGAARRVVSRRKKVDEANLTKDPKKISTAQKNRDEAWDLEEQAVKKRNFHRTLRTGLIGTSTLGGGYAGYVGRNVVLDKDRPRTRWTK